MGPERTGWFADIDPEYQDHPHGWWQAVLQVDGCCFPLAGIWFQTEEQCLYYIREHILGRGMLSD